MEQVMIKNLYDELFEFFNSNCLETEYLEHLKEKNVLVIAVGAKAQIISLIAYLNQREEKPSNIYMIIQKNMIPMVRNLENEQCHFIEWEGPYTRDVISHIISKIDICTVSHLFYQGRQRLDFRDINLYDILIEIKNQYRNTHQMRVYVQDIQENVYWYKNPEKIREGMKVYQAIDAYLEV